MLNTLILANFSSFGAIEAPLLLVVLVASYMMLKYHLWRTFRFARLKRYLFNFGAKSLNTKKYANFDDFVGSFWGIWFYSFVVFYDIEGLCQAVIENQETLSAMISTLAAT